MASIPVNIDWEESLSHALFYKSDCKREPKFWAKSRALIPPPRNPQEVSFNRACHLPDNAQKKFALDISRPYDEFSGFVVTTSKAVEEGLKILKQHCPELERDRLPFHAEFRFSPIWKFGSDEHWPAEVDYLFGNGYHAAHCDLWYSHTVVKGEVNTVFVRFAEIDRAHQIHSRWNN